MSKPPENQWEYDIYGIGEASIDLTIPITEELLQELKLRKGDSNDIDLETLKKLIGENESNVILKRPGGSVFNTICTLGSLGLKVVFTGKAAYGTEHGNIFRNELKTRNIQLCCNDEECKHDDMTIIACLITPDGERTFGIHGDLTKQVNHSDINGTILDKTNIFLFSGYIWREKNCTSEIRRIISERHAKGKKIAFTPSANFCIYEHGDEFREMINDKKIDILLANEEEINYLITNSTKLKTSDEKLKTLSKEKEMTIVMTRGPQNPKIFHEDKVYEISIIGATPEEIINTNGAGDAFTAGFLYGYSKNLDFKQSAKIGHLMAYSVIKNQATTLETESIQKLMNEYINKTIFY